MKQLNLLESQRGHIKDLTANKEGKMMATDKPQSPPDLATVPEKTPWHQR